MKLKKLSINNIASIENAEIDFANGLLADQDLFLITGPTGTGKSTILDAISLALFDNTPRIDSSTTDLVDNLAEKDVRIKNVLNLVRKNAVNASVTLSFIGIDGKEYIARWSVIRTGQFRKGNEVSKFSQLPLAEKLNANMIKEWTISEANGSTFEKKSEVESLIQKTVGMTFDQFCKTTVLAQGSFSEFLKSNSDKKAEILEKLVGTEKYAEVGKVINRIANDKKNEADTIADRIQHIHFLNNDEITERKKNIEDAEKEIEKLGQQEASITKKIQWLTDMAAAKENVITANNNYMAALNASEEKEITDKKRAIALWDITSKVREALKTLSTLHTEASSLFQKETSLAQSYTHLTTGLANMQTVRMEKETLKQKLDSFFSETDKYSGMFANIDTIIKTHDEYVHSSTFVNENKPKLDVFDKELDHFDKQIVEIEPLKKQELDKKEKQISLYQDLDSKLKIHHADTINAESDELHTLFIAINEAKSAYQNFTDAKTDFEQKSKKLSDIKNDIKGKTTKVANALTDLETATSDRKDKESLYNKAKESVSDHAKALRAELKEGDLCPVCGHKIDTILSDNTFIESLRPLKDAYELAKSKEEEHRDKHAKAKADLEAAEKTLKETSVEADAAEKKMTECNKKLVTKCQAINANIDDNLADTFAEKEATANAKKSDIAARQNAIQDIRKQMSETNQAVSLIEKKIKEYADNLEKVRGERVKKENEKQNLQGSIKKENDDAIRFKNELESLIDSNWRQKKDGDFYIQLKAEADEYKRNKELFDKNNDEISRLNNEITSITSIKEAIKKMHPEWNDGIADGSTVAKDITALWGSLKSECESSERSINDNKQKQKDAEQIKSDFFMQNTEISEKDVYAVINLSDNDVMSMRNAVNNVEKAKNETKLLLDESNKRADALSQDPISQTLSGDDTQDTLNAEKARLSDTRNQMAETIGKIKQELADDEKNNVELGHQKQKLIEIQKERAQWESLDKYLGGPEGKRFRNVAQSFILSELLDKANEYLTNITDRYSLFCNPGTLTIMMRDAYQGGSERTTNTLSGGEGFIISLALALGLSSMQSVGFEVDTLFIDEGFGTLSAEHLDPVVTSLKRLHETCGRRVGIISHVESLKTRIPVTVEVKRHGRSNSIIEIQEN